MRTIGSFQKIGTKRKSKLYKYVYNIVNWRGKAISWYYNINDKGKQLSKFCTDERQAAVEADIILIKLGREPVNILKKK